LLRKSSRERKGKPVWELVGRSGGAETGVKQSTIALQMEEKNESRERGTPRIKKKQKKKIGR